MPVLCLMLQAKRQAALLKKRLGRDIELNEFEMVSGKVANRDLLVLLCWMGDKFRLMLRDLKPCREHPQLNMSCRL